MVATTVILMMWRCIPWTVLTMLVVGRAMLLARIYECLPLTCPKCGQPMRLIAFIMEPPVVEKILLHIGEPTSMGQAVKTYLSSTLSAFGLADSVRFK